MSSSHLLLQIIPKWLLFYIIWWVLNLEYNSSLGNIWYRPDSSGKYIFAYKSIFSLIYKPIKQLFLNKEKWLWSNPFIDLNIYFMLFISIICSFCTYIMSENIFPAIYNLI
jgi:hypothetical protein